MKNWTGCLPTALAPSGLAASFRAVVAFRLFFLVLALSSPALAQRPPATTPTDPHLVIETLPRGYASLAPTKAPASTTNNIARIRQLLATAARTGDFRLATRAEAMLSDLPAADRSLAVLSARAYVAQHRHDFTAAITLLDEVIVRVPRDGEARLSRAQIQIVQGRLKRAHADCTALLGIDVADGMLCAASLSLRRGDNAGASALLDRWLVLAPASGDGRRYALTMRAEAAARGGDAAANGWFQKALAIDPSDVRTLAAYARYLRSAGKYAAVETLLAGHADSDGLQLQRTLAAAAARSELAKTLILKQAERYRVAHRVGNRPELRDEADFLLQTQRQPRRALALAQENFESQRDQEDVDLLMRAAVAAAQLDALDSLQTWAKSEQLDLPALPADGRP
jgi:hypothetical protein